MYIKHSYYRLSERFYVFAKTTEFLNLAFSKIKIKRNLKIRLVYNPKR